MTDSRQHRVDTLRQAARRKSEAKTKAAEAAIRTLVKRGEPITFQSVHREAGVSHAFLYGNADLRARIERLRAQAHGENLELRRELARLGGNLQPSTTS